MKKDSKNNRKNNGKRYCKTCSRLLVKDGFDRNKNQRWLCKNCKTSIRLKDERQRNNEVFKKWLNWMLTKKTIDETVDYSRFTFWRNTKAFWDIVPTIIVTGEIYNHILIDATYLSKKALLVLFSPKGVVGFRWGNSENVEDYILLFKSVPAPHYIVSDGHRTIESACRKAWKNTKIQRCFVHLKRFVQRKVGKFTENEIGQLLHKHCRKLFSIDTIAKAKRWEKAFLTDFERHKEYIDEKVACEKRTPKSKGYYLRHRNLSVAWHHILSPLKKGHMWSFLSDEIKKCPRDTNRLEGGINTRIKELIMCHRGIKFSHEQRIAEWFLLSKSEFGIQGFLDDFHPFS